MMLRSSKITIFMVLVVLCAFALCGCGGSDTATDDTAVEEQTPTPEDEEVKAEGPAEAQKQVEITVTSPGEDTVAEGGTLHIAGNAAGVKEPGKDKVWMELLADDDDLKLGEANSLVSDLDYAFSADLKYEISDNMEKNDDGTIDAKLRIFVKNENDTIAKEEIIDVKVK